jgi:DNA replication initiation complex subunit (GINS family)
LNSDFSKLKPTHSFSIGNTLRGWQQTLELLQRGELSADEIDALPLQLMRDSDDAIKQLKLGGGRDAKELGEAKELMRVLGKVERELRRILKDRLWLRRFGKTKTHPAQRFAAAKTGL